MHTDSFVPNCQFGLGQEDGNTIPSEWGIGALRHTGSIFAHV